MTSETSFRPAAGGIDRRRLLLLGAAKLKALAEARGVDYRAIYARDPATYETVFRTLGDAGAAVVVTTFNAVADPLKAVAPAYPGTTWIQLYADPIEPALPNVVTVSYDY